ncbi:Fic family protein [Gemmatimonas sp.]|jgi:Fic family protein|uniref:Fic family protein n=1 Tax=Gemmatimonas sp. TaxID=1962908 RepID=UPI0037BEA736
MFESALVLKKTATAGRKLAELKGLAASMPNQGILINTLALQEAKDSSAIENIVTTHDELFRSATYPDLPTSPAAKEVRHYVHALRAGFALVREHGLLTANHIVTIQGELEKNAAGFRDVTVVELMRDLEAFINDQAAFDADPLIKMAIAHHQFESIHPFHDGNGRTGRIVNVLYLVNNGLLDIPVLYLSSYIVRHKADYYRLLQAVRDQHDAPEIWEEWVMYMLNAIETTAQQTIHTITDIRAALMDYKHRIRASFKFYSQDLINNLFTHPYTKIDFVERDLNVSRITATKYLDLLTQAGFVRKVKVGRSNYYINVALNSILTRG